MAQERRGTAEESAMVPDQRPEPAPDPAVADTGQGNAAQIAADTPGAAAPDTPAAPAAPQYHSLRRTRLSGTWVAIIFFALILVFLLIFILQNSHTVEVSYFGAHGHFPLGVALLLAAVSGVLLVALAGSARIMQLRATARKHRRADSRAMKAQRKR